MESPSQGTSLKINNNPCQDTTEEEEDQTRVLRVKSRQELVSKQISLNKKKIYDNIFWKIYFENIKK